MTCSNSEIMDGPCGATITLDPDEIFIDDPGQGTPAIVEWNNHCGTFWCCEATGEVDGYPLPEEVCAWLRAEGDYVNCWLDEQVAEKKNGQLHRLD